MVTRHEPDPTHASLSRRRLLAVGGAGLVAGLAQAPGAMPGPGRTSPAAAASPERPNILWFVSEDNNPFVGAYGDPLARTPTIDRLAAEGVRYEHAYSTAPVCAPTRFSIITGVRAESAGPAHNMRAEGEIPEEVVGFPEHLRAAGYYCTNNSKTDYNAPIDVAATWDRSSATAHWSSRPDGAPFFAVFNSMTTHESSQFRAQDGASDPADMVVPPFLPDTPTVRADRAHYYDSMARMDGELAARLDELEQAGLAEDTIVFYYGDNGGVLPWSKRFATEAGLHVPLVVRFPEKWKHLAPAAAGSVVDGPVTLMDLGPTVLSLAGVTVPAYVQGRPLAGTARIPAARYAFSMRNRMDERYDMVRTVTDGELRYIRNYSPHRPYGQHVGYMWQQKSYQDWEQAHLDGTLDAVQERFWQAKPAEELYDVRTDPDCLHDLTGSPHHRADLQRLRRALDEHLVTVNDNGFIPEGSPLEGYDDSRVPGAYPIRQVIRLAGQAIERRASHGATFVRRLRDDNEVVRYWAAQGLLILGADARRWRGDLEQAWRRETSPQVRVALSEALAGLGTSQPVVDWLVETLDTHPDRFVRLQAINALTFLGEAARPALPAADRAAAGTDEYLRRAGVYLAQQLRGTYTPGSAA